jgi:hypothetical protein
VQVTPLASCRMPEHSMLAWLERPLCGPILYLRVHQCNRPLNGRAYSQIAGIKQVCVFRSFQRGIGAFAVAFVARADIGEDSFIIDILSTRPAFP